MPSSISSSLASRIHFSTGLARVAPAAERVHRGPRAPHRKIGPIWPAANSPQGAGVPPPPRRHRRERQLWVERWLRGAREPALRAVAAEVYRRLHYSMRELIQDGADAGAVDDHGVRALLDEDSMPVTRARDVDPSASSTPRPGLVL